MSTPGIDVPDARGRTGLDRVGRDLTGNPDVVVTDVELLASGWHVLRRTTFEQRHRDGRWTTEQRETYDRGNGATILLHDVARGTVLLTCQFRFPVYVNGHPDGMLLEAPAGTIDDGETPEHAIRRELVEEVGHRVDDVELCWAPYASPGALTERMWLFATRYSDATRVGAGGGKEEEREHLEVVELELGSAYAMVDDGRIVDLKTVLLLEWMRRRDRA